MAKYEDEISESESDDELPELSLKMKVPKDESNMPMVNQYPLNRYKEHR